MDALTWISLSSTSDSVRTDEEIDRAGELSSEWGAIPISNKAKKISCIQKKSKIILLCLILMLKENYSTTLNVKSMKWMAFLKGKISPSEPAERSVMVVQLLLW
jgi:hypothetical protein